MTMQRTLKLYRLPDAPQLKGFRKFRPADLDVTYKLVNQVDTHVWGLSGPGELPSMLSFK